jgi:hypothetical protein
MATGMPLRLFLRLVPVELVELAWVTAGTSGLESVVTVELSPAADGTLIKLAHRGFPTEELRDAHVKAWPGSSWLTYCCCCGQLSHANASL